MARLFEDGFDSGDFSLWTAQENVQGINTIELQLPHTGLYAGRFYTNPTTLAAYSRVVKDITPDVDIYARAYVNIQKGLPLLAAGDRFYLIRFEDASHAYLATVGIRRTTNNEDKWLLIGKSGTPFAPAVYGSIVPATPTWVCLELHVRIATAGAIEVYVDGVKIIEVLGDTTSFAGIASVAFGITTKSATASTFDVDVIVDDCVIAQEYIGTSVTPPPPSHILSINSNVSVAAKVNATPVGNTPVSVSVYEGQVTVEVPLEVTV